MSQSTTSRRELISARARTAIRDTMSDTVLREIDEMWQDELFPPTDNRAPLRVEDRLRVLGPDHPDTKRSRNHLAVPLAKAGRAGEAVTMLQEVLVERLRSSHPDHPNTRGSE